MIYFCCDSRRRDLIENQAVYNGIDFLEVTEDQRTLLVHFIHPLAPDQLDIRNVRIEGGERIRNVEIKSIEEAASPPDDPRILVLTVQKPGDFSIYTLRLIDAVNLSGPPPNIDYVLSSIDFSFKAACKSDFDCQPQHVCPAVPTTPVHISYLAKDYASFRQLMLDRMAKIIPEWQERSPADLGIGLLEMLAYVGDYLSYQQDVVATEAYLNTARKRTSVRRHVRLTDYPMHDGRNARTWVRFHLAASVPPMSLDPSKLTYQFLTHTGLADTVLAVPSAKYDQALSQSPQVFELMEGMTLFAEHSQMQFYTWGSRQCCLPQGATSAWLRGGFPNLKQDDVLVFQEIAGPNTGQREDANPAHRHAVRLTKVTPAEDPLGGPLTSPLTSVALTAIEWAQADALPFSLCLSSKFGTEYFDNVSVAYGNVALVDHGLTIAGEQLERVPAPNPALTLVTASGRDPCNRVPLAPVQARYRPQLRRAPLTFHDAYATTGPATAALSDRALNTLLPSITLAVPGDPDRWQPKRDLLTSDGADPDFVAEVENDGTAYLRFGDGIFGARPAAGTQFSVTYRVGNGVAGNIGADSLYHFATNDGGIDPSVIVNVGNPLPASGGLEPEPLDVVRQNAPYAFRVQNRAVTAEDYTDVAQRIDASIQRAQANFRWTGSWRTVFIAADRKGGALVDDYFREQLKRGMELYRMAGHDVDVDTPVYVSLELEMSVCVKPDYLASDIQRILLDRLSNRVLPGGELGLFHPDNFSFGQPVYLSRIYAAVQGTDGVESVNITKFQRRGAPSDKALNEGKLELERMEIARLDNDPNFPEHGSLTIHPKGGR